MVLSFAQGKFTDRYLSDRGVYPTAAIWRWHPGVKGGVFEEHRDLNGERAGSEFEFSDHPDTSVNAQWCQCQIQIQYRDDRGRYAPPPQVGDFVSEPEVADVQRIA
jgi:hypothetical protein